MKDSRAYISGATVSSSLRLSGSIGVITGFPGTAPSTNCLKSLNMAAIAHSPNIFIPFFADIWVNITNVATNM
eukprot:4840568-Ditylum_brightwellii.AAC.1